MPLFVFAGIYSGYFAVSEAAAVTAMYVLVVEVLIYREISLSRVPGIIRESMIMVGGILLILGVSLALTNYLIDAEAPMRLFQLCRTFVSSKLVFLVLLNIFLLDPGGHAGHFFSHHHHGSPDAACGGGIRGPSRFTWALSFWPICRSATLPRPWA